MTFVFVPEEGEVIQHPLLFQSMFLLFSRHKWLRFSFWKQGKLFVTLCYFIPCFLHFLEINDFCFHFEVEEVIYNTLPFQSMFLLFSWHKWLLFLFRKKGKSWINICYFKPCFSHFLDVNGFCFCSGSRRSYSSHFAFSSYVSAIFLT